VRSQRKGVEDRQLYDDPDCKNEFNQKRVANFMTVVGALPATKVRVLRRQRGRTGARGGRDDC
jgi:hypothetical protein